MSKNNLEDLRDALFAALAEARDTSKPLDLQRARTTCEIAARITDTARLEIDFMRATGNKTGSGFVRIGEDPDQAQDVKVESKQLGNQTITKVPGGQVITHRMR